MAPSTRSKTPKAAASGTSWTFPAKCVVTGAAGLCGRRLVEMLVERGAKEVVAFDVAPQPKDFADDPKVRWVKGDLTKPTDCAELVAGADCVWHIAALVGPYFPKPAYYNVNYVGTKNLVDACKEAGVRKIVMSSSPSTRMDGNSINWKREDELEIRPPGQFLEPYAETKAMGEVYCREACDGESLLTVAVAPHQVYGPHDGLFLTNFLRNAKQLRIFGKGDNEISMVHVDNYCHALIIAEKALYPGSPALGKFYIATDGPPQKLWRVLDAALTHMGFASVFSKFKVPVPVIMPIAHVVQAVNRVMGWQLKLKPFSVKMLVINRTFNIENIQRDLGYEPLMPFSEAWPKTLKWFKENRSFWDY